MPRRDRPEDRLDELAEALQPALPISVLLLGMGADMHTASLFPGADRLDEALDADAPAADADARARRARAARHADRAGADGARCRRTS